MAAASQQSVRAPQSLPLLPLKVHPRRPSTAVWAVGRFVFAYDVQRRVWEQRRRELHLDVIRALDFFLVPGQESTTRWLSAGDDKAVVVWEEDGGDWQLGPKLSHSKKITAAIFDRAGHVVFADRFGDVYRWSAGQESAQAQLLASHLAIVTALAMTRSGRFLVVGDNHEKVRISCYPQTTEIRSICLGHSSQITAVATVRGPGNVEEAVLSGSSDGSLRLWSLDGEPLGCWQLGSAISSLSCAVEGDAALVACEDPSPGLRKVSLKTAGEVAEAPLLVDEALQAVCTRPGDGPPLWVDRRGHLRFRSAGEAAVWEDIFDGEDLPPCLATLCKSMGEAEADGEGAEGEEEDADKGRASKKKRRQ